MDANKLSLNIDKTNYIIFHSSSSNVPSGSNIKIGKKQIKRVKFVKFLDILLDEHLSWKYHLSELAKKLSRTCGMFLKIRNLLPLDVLVCLYNALFLSFLQYGLIVWGQTYASYIDPIFKLQNWPSCSIYIWMTFSCSWRKPKSATMRTIRLSMRVVQRSKLSLRI